MRNTRRGEASKGSSMKVLRHCSVLVFVAHLLALSGCATITTQKVGPTSIIQAQEEIPEEQLMDVGIAVFDTEEFTEEQAKKEGTHPDIRKAEGHFIPYHLKNTLQQSGHWGAVRVMPTDNSVFDLMVKGKILKSNGENLVVQIEVVDASGKAWLQKSYKAKATKDSYEDNVPGMKDGYQDLYNSIANDLVMLKEARSPSEIQNTRTAAKLRFAAEFAPDAFRDYLTEEDEGQFRINRLPADDDSMMERLLKIRDRDLMFVDTLNHYYDGFYIDMWPAYENWRKANLTEQTALRKMKRDAYMRQIAGALMLAMAIALDAGNVKNTNALQSIMILGGGAVIIDGVNVSREAEIHREAIQELSESFGGEMQPLVMEFQGKSVELTGSAEEQYKRWRELLREIYYTETGFDRPDAAKENIPGNQ